MRATFLVLMLSFAAACGGGDGNNSTVNGATNASTNNATNIATDAGNNTADPCGSYECTNGRCLTDGAEPVCVCDDGWTGDACDTCDNGGQDNDGDGICSPSCGSDPAPCGTESCDDSTGEAVCSCPTGQSFDAESGTCEFSTLIDTSDGDWSQWQAFGGAEFDPEHLGELGSIGGFLLPHELRCEREPTAFHRGLGIESTIELAPLEDLGPTKLEFVWSGECSGSCFSQIFWTQFGDSIYSEQSLAETTTTTVSECLPLGAYGAGEIPVRIWQQSLYTDCSAGRNPTLESVRLVRAEPGECEYAPLDEDFDSYAQGDPLPPEWAGTTGFRFVESAGGTALGFVNRDADNNCNGSSSVTLPGRVPLPSAGNGVALSFDYTFSSIDTTEAVLRWDLARRWGFVPETASGTYVRCLGPELFGLEDELTLGIQSGCEDGTSATIDNVRFVESSECTGNLADGSFREELQRNWDLELEGEATVDVGEAGRDRFLRLRVGNWCDRATVLQTVSRVAEPTANAMQFRYSHPVSSTNPETRARVTVPGRTEELPVSRGEVEHTICLPYARTPGEVLFSLSSTMSCALPVSFPEETMTVENVELVFDPACP